MLFAKMKQESYICISNNLIIIKMKTEEIEVPITFSDLGKTCFGFLSDAQRDEVLTSIGTISVMCCVAQTILLIKDGCLFSGYTNVSVDLTEKNKKNIVKELKELTDEMLSLVMSFETSETDPFTINVNIK